MNSIRVIGRAAQGVKIVRLKSPEDRVSSVSVADMEDADATSTSDDEL